MGRINKKLISELSQIIAELDPKNELAFDDLPFHRQLSYRAKAREVITIIKCWKEKKTARRTTKGGNMTKEYDKCKTEDDIDEDTAIKKYDRCIRCGTHVKDFCWCHHFQNAHFWGCPGCYTKSDVQEELRRKPRREPCFSIRKSRSA